VDIAFFSANLLKVFHGGWFPLLIASVLCIVMATWHRGRQQLRRQLEESSIDLGSFLQSLFRHPPPRVKGTAIFLTTTPNAVPHALMHNLAHNKVLHERVVFLTVVIRDQPYVPDAERVQIEDLIHNCFRLTVYFGFKDRPDVMQALELCRAHDLGFPLLETSFFLSREALIPSVRVAGMALWRDRLFATMARNASSAVEYFNLPTNRVIEIGTQIEI
jgi:KUP system potassium uptake protein